MHYIFAEFVQARAWKQKPIQDVLMDNRRMWIFVINAWQYFIN